MTSPALRVGANGPPDNAGETLPDHLHCLWTLPEGDSNFSVRWALIKRDFTQGIRGSQDEKAIAEVPTPSRQRHREAAVWQRRFWEHQIRNAEDYSAHMDYVHYNPVKHGLVSSPDEWPYSTFAQCVSRGLYDPGWGASGNLVLGPHVGHE